MAILGQLRLPLILLALAALVWYLWQPGETANVAAEPLPDEFLGQPDLYLLDAQITQYLPTGAVKYKLDSRNIRHFEQDGITRLDQPTLNLRQPDQAPWVINAKQGFIRKAAGPDGNIEEIVFLRSDVKLEQTLADGSFLRLQSDSLYVYPDRQFAQTNDNVMIDTEAGRTKGVGMKANLAGSELQVFSEAPVRVQSVILPDQFK